MKVSKRTLLIVAYFLAIPISLVLGFVGYGASISILGQATTDKVVAPIAVCGCAALIGLGLLVFWVIDRIRNPLAYRDE